MFASLKVENNPAVPGICYGLLAALLWGAWPVVSSLGLREQTLTAYDITALRFGVAGVLLLPLIIKRGVRGIGWIGALILAFGAGVPYMLITVAGMTYAPASHMGIIAPSSMMTISTIGSWLILGDRPDRTRIIGLIVIILGVALLGGQALISSQRQDQWVGDLLFVAGGACWACYTVGSKYFKADPLHATALVAVISMILYLPLYFTLGEPKIFTAPGNEVIFQALFQGVGSAFLALLFYTKAVSLLGAARGAVFAALVPGIAVLLAYPILGESLSVLEFAGVCVVTIGMVGALGLIKWKK
ncbi:DMT family transporter [Kiloniella laminariae]|uniref:DMT family transporter n=1 Tax=Kiloniella laminariae TaxID=454162 RepID=A0ABT4LNL9_9PROT|nr:DMT family transporter [Kiloniella laminariae]MCZ4282742.1 DMT family transporter [Kiloniella laminariae]